MSVNRRMSSLPVGSFRKAASSYVIANTWEDRSMTTPVTKTLRAIDDPFHELLDADSNAANVPT